MATKSFNSSFRKKYTRSHARGQIQSGCYLAVNRIQRIRLTAETAKNLTALSGVAYKNFRAIFPLLVAPNPAPKISGGMLLLTKSSDNPKNGCTNKSKGA